MRKALLTTILLMYLVSSGQNLTDAYGPGQTSPKLWQQEITRSYDGEYQIFLDRLYWNADSEETGYPVLRTSAISFSIEVVSFPFIPKDSLQDITNVTNRVLNTDILDNDHDTLHIIENGDTLYSGLGWEYQSFKIFSRTDNINHCDSGTSPECSGHYSLITQAYETEEFSPSTLDLCLFPHTVLKHTLYFHCDSTLESDIIDSLSWLYDNTRGTMSTYPWKLPTRQKKEKYNILDVVFRPTFQDYPSGVPYPYINTPIDWDSNYFYYDSGLDPNHGSINYFPKEEVDNPSICSNYPLYYSGTQYTGLLVIDSSTFDYYSSYVHPPPYSLLDAPLLNSTGEYFAGYQGDGDSLHGYKHSYEITKSFNLTTINPNERIIYNPSEVTIKANLTFPTGYQFRTLHGKYPDRSELESGSYTPAYFDSIPCFEFLYDKDYPVPVNCSTNKACKSHYILESCVLTFQPYVIIMDAHFSGTSSSDKSTIRLDPDCTYGNWTVDTSTVRLERAQFIVEDCRLKVIEKNEEYSMQNAESKSNNSNRIDVFNSGTYIPTININVQRTSLAYVKVFDYFGNIVLEENISNKNQMINCNMLKRGVYFAVLVVDNEIIDSKSFSKM